MNLEWAPVAECSYQFRQNPSSGSRNKRTTGPIDIPDLPCVIRLQTCNAYGNTQFPCMFSMSLHSCWSCYNIKYHSGLFIYFLLGKNFKIGAHGT
jgi:hypothetical protein